MKELSFRCDDCSVDTRHINEYYMVKNSVWNSVAKFRCMLCIGCLETRLNRLLTKKDFIDAPINNGYFKMSNRLKNRLRFNTLINEDDRLIDENYMISIRFDTSIQKFLLNLFDEEDFIIMYHTGNIKAPVHYYTNKNVVMSTEMDYMWFKQHTGEEADWLIKFRTEEQLVLFKTMYKTH